MPKLDAKNHNGIPPMAEAAEACQLELVIGLAAHNASLDVKNNNGITPMAETAEAGQLELVNGLSCSRCQFGCRKQQWHYSNG